MIADRRTFVSLMIGGVLLLLTSAAALAVDYDAGNGVSTVPPSQPSSQPAEETWPPGLLMTGLEKTGARKPLDDAGIRFWGFTEAGFTGNLTNGQETLFGRSIDARRVDNMRLNQLRLTADRVYDASKPFDWGFRVDGMFGGDAKLVHSFGLLDHAGQGNGDAWADIVQANVQGWFKTGNQSGLEMTLGKFLTPMGIETVDATANPLYSRSYLGSFATPTTHTGINLKYKFSEQVSAYFCLCQGWDDFRDNNDAPSYMTGFALSSKEQIGGHARDQFAFNVITGPEQPDNNVDYRTLLDSTATHWWTDKLSSSVEGDWATEEQLPGAGRANWYGLAHFLTYVFNDRVSATWRTEWFADDTGVRIGKAGNYHENTFGVNLTPWPAHDILKNLSFRPEVRWDNSDQRVFGDSHDQMTVAFDVIFKF